MSDAPAEPLAPEAQRELRELAETAARLGGAVARSYFRRDVAIRLKADRSEVSEADEVAQAAIIQQIRASRPADAFITEETLATADEESAPPAPDNQHICWVIDPIDGTRNFVRGLPQYACSIGAMLGGFPVVGAVYEPQRDAMFSASRAEGLFFDRVRTQPRPVPIVAGQPLNAVVGIPSQPAAPVTELVHEWLSRFVCRNLGSTALHMALVATGELDAMVADNARLWDIAAGWVLLDAVGAKVTTPDGDPLFPLDVAKYRQQKIPLIAARAELYERVRHPRGRPPRNPPPVE